MIRRTVVGGAVAALVLAASASATVGAGADVSGMTLQATDLPGAKQVAAGVANEPGYDAYRRTFVFDKPYGSARVGYVSSEALLAQSADDAAMQLTRLRQVYQLKAARAAFASSLAKTLKLKAKYVKVGKPKLPKLGDHTLELAFSVKTKAARVYGTVLYLQLDRALVQQEVDGLRPAGGASERFARLTASHIAAGLAPVSLTVPVVTGMPVQGQTLTSDSGTWSEVATYAYQWQRCDASGANCVDIDGATQSTYLVGADDAGATLRVMVTANARFGTVQAPSAVTAAIS